MFLRLAERISAMFGVWDVATHATFDGPMPGLPTMARAALAALVACLVVLTSGRRAIEWLRARFQEPIKNDSARLRDLHRHKARTPTMGGLVMGAAVAVALLACGDATNRFLQLALVTMAGFGLVGFADDWIKLRRPSHGMSAPVKLACQAVIALAVAWLLKELRVADWLGAADRTAFAAAFGWLPGGSQPGGSPSWWFIPWAAFVMMAASNAVNLTDGLDGLASGCSIVTIVGLAVGICWAAGAGGDSTGALAAAGGAGEILVVAGAMLGALGGFLWFNRHPARMFMGDTGSLPLGALLGLLALVPRMEWLLLVVGAVFVAEAASVAVQIGFYKWTRRRLFLCAPLHHHYQFKGWPERKIVARFWAASAVAVVLGLGLLDVALVTRRGAAGSDSTAGPRVVETSEAHEAAGSERTAEFTERTRF